MRLVLTGAGEAGPAGIEHLTGRKCHVEAVEHVAAVLAIDIEPNLHFMINTLVSSKRYLLVELK